MTLILNKIFLFLIKVLRKIKKNAFLEKRLNCSLILKKNFKERKKFVFIQVGANDGISFDNLYEIVNKRESKGVVIEPIKEYFDQLVYNYQSFEKIVKINKAVHPTLNKMSLFKIKKKAYIKYPDWVKGIASFNKEHYKQFNINDDDVEVVEVISDHLMKMISHNLTEKEIDFFQIDVEGFDFEVIKMIDFNCLKPKIIKFENVNLSIADLKSANEILLLNGYYIFKEGNDTIALDLKKINLI
jgi:FkbM family methyltransferase